MGSFAITLGVATVVASLAACAPAAALPPVPKAAASPAVQPAGTLVPPAQAVQNGNRAGDLQLPDAGSLTKLSQQAKQLALRTTSDPVLRQVNVNPTSGELSFHFTDAQATFEVQVLLPSPSTPSDRWQVSRPDVSLLVGHARPGMDLQSLRIGPAGAVGEGHDVTWHGFCNLPDGRVASGTINGQTGAFQASAAPPAQPPAVATAVPSR